MALNYLKKLLSAQRYMLGFTWKNNRGLFFLMLAECLAGSVLSPVFVWLTGRLMRELENGSGLGTAVACVAELILWGLSVKLLILFFQKKSHWQKIALNEKLSLALFEKSCNMDIDILETPAVQTLYHEADSATGNNRCAKILESVFTVFSSVVSLVLTAAVMVNIELWIFAVFAVVIVLKTVSVVRTKKQKFRNWKLDRELQKEFNYQINLLFDDDCAQEMRMTGLSGWMIQKYGAVARRARTIEEKETRQIARNKYIDALLTYAQQGVLYGFLAYKVVFKTLSLSEFTVFFTGVTSMSSNIEAFIAAILDAGENSVYLTAYMEYMDIPNKIALHRPSDVVCTRDMVSQSGISFENVCFTYPGSEIPVLKDVSLSLEPGKFYMIVGENGAGKTTLIKLLCRLYDPTSGYISVGGLDIRRFDFQSYRGNIGIVFQNYKVYEYTVGENIAMDEWDASDPPERRIWEVLEKINLAKKIRSLPKGLFTPLGRTFSPDGVNLSGGETQKIALAKAIYHDKGILILDEPSSALDALAENELIDSFFSVMGGRTIFYISHRLSAARRADKILFMSKGTVSAVGTHAELMQNCPGYAKMYNAQAKNYQET